MHETKNLELLKKFDNEEGSVRLYFRDIDNVTYSITVPDIKTDDYNVSALSVLCKMYNVDSIDDVSYMRGCIVDDKLKNVGHIINDDWLLSIIQSINRYGSYFKYCLSLNDKKSITADLVNDKFSISSDKKRNKQPNEYTVCSKEAILLIYNSNLKTYIKVKFDKKYVDYLKKVYWHFSERKNGPKMYISRDSYGTGMNEETIQDYLKAMIHENIKVNIVKSSNYNDVIKEYLLEIID